MKRIILGTALLSIGAMAATPSTTESKTTSEVKADTTKQYVRTIIDESMANREDKKYTINAEVSGYAYGAGSTSIEFGYFNDLNTIINVRLSNLKSLRTEYSVEEENDIWERDGKGTVLSVGMKKFTSNSFYIRPEVYVRNQENVNSVSWEYSSANDSYNYYSNKTKYRDTGISFRIGNQWQWEKFTIGCDWIGITRSLYTLEQSGKYTQENKNSGSILNFYMGASF